MIIKYVFCRWCHFWRQRDTWAREDWRRSGPTWHHIFKNEWLVSGWEVWHRISACPGVFLQKNAQCLFWWEKLSQCCAFLSLAFDYFEVFLSFFSTRWLERRRQCAILVCGSADQRWNWRRHWKNAAEFDTNWTNDCCSILYVHFQSSWFSNVYQCNMAALWNAYLPKWKNAVFLPSNNE